MKSTGNSNHSLFLPINVLTVLYCDSNSCLIHLDTYLVCKVSPSANLILMISYDIHSEFFLNKYSNSFHGNLYKWADDHLLIVYIICVTRSICVQ